MGGRSSPQLWKVTVVATGVTKDEYETALLEALIDGKLLGVFNGPGHQRLERIRGELGMT